MNDLNTKPAYVNNIQGKFYNFTSSHPTITRVSLTALAIFSSPVLLPTLAISSVVLFGRGVYFGYSALETIKKVIGLYSAIIDIIAPYKHDMTNHAFKEGTYGNATLTYEGDVPVLTLKQYKDCEHPGKHLGFDYGYLLGVPLQQFLAKWDSFLWVVFPSPAKLKKLCENLKKTIPPQYLDEMRGVVKGYNTKMKELGSKDRITLDKLLIFHLVPDMLHSKPGVLEEKLSGKHKKDAAELSLMPGFGCTTILDYNKDGEVVFGRNMDWPSLSVTGTYAYLIRRQHGDKTILEIGTPGLVGTSTALNSKGLAIAMNVCEGETQNLQGIPACIFNRMCIEQCNSVDEVETFVQQHNPLGPFHLTSADRQKAEAFHFYQGDNNTHVKRPLIQGKPVVTTNCRYTQNGNQYSHYFASKERHANIKQCYDRSQGKEWVQEALSLPIVNNVETVHHVVMSPGTGKMSVKFNNAFAGNDPIMHEVKC